MRTKQILAVVIALAAVMTQPCAAGGDHADREGRKPNRLAEETSPYLLQHAYNPVDWRAWGPEAFEAARAQDKLIFVSIGYSTCYWCHVMERESFENEAIAAQMNRDFICIKVDREERPDVDNIYITAVQQMKGRGGWPLSVFLEPATLKPVRGGTYFPAVSSRGRSSFPDVMTDVLEKWNTDRATMLGYADRIADRVYGRLERAKTPTAIGRVQVQKAVDGLLVGHDRVNGGFRRGAPKFPVPVNVDLLIEVAWDRPGVQAALRRTLDGMAMGGIYDQVGGGFHRYSTDARWLVPHFEKMLYDNGQLASVYAKAYERTGDPFYAQITRETLDYVLREMTGEGGAFYSAQDAEVNAREGGSYVWTGDEVGRALATAGLATEIDFTTAVYGLGTPNFRDPHHPGDGMKSVLHRVTRPDAQAATLDMDQEAFERRLARVRSALLAARDLREQPGTDDKIIVAWNALAIIGFVDAARALDEPRYLEAAEGATRFILDNMRTPEGGLYRTWRAGEARIDAFLIDYALLIDALLALNEATGDPFWRQAALVFAGQVRARFQDDASGGFFNTEAGQSDLFVRSRQLRDSVMPCGNSVMLGVLPPLADLSGVDQYATDAAGTLASMSSTIARNPGTVPRAVRALHRIVNEHPGLLPTEAPGAGKTPTANNPVLVSTSVDTVAIKPGQPGRVDVTLEIAPKFHINANEPGQPQLVPLEIRIMGGGGVTITPEYPQGELYRDELRIHRGRVTVPVRIEQTGPIDGNPRLMVVYQPCTDRACLVSVGKVLPVRIARQGNRPTKNRRKRTGS